MLPCGKGGINLFAILGGLALLGSVLATLIYSVRSRFVGAPRSHDSGVRRSDPSLLQPLHDPLDRRPRLAVEDRDRLPCHRVAALDLWLGRPAWRGNLFGAISVAVAYLGTWWEKHATMIGKVTESPIWKSIWPMLYTVLAVYGILFLAYGTALYLQEPTGPHWWWILILAVVTVSSRWSPISTWSRSTGCIATG